MMEVLVSKVGFTFLECFRTLRDWSKFALGSRTNLRGHVDISDKLNDVKGVKIHPDYHKQPKYTLLSVCLHLNSIILTGRDLLCPLLASLCITVLPMTDVPLAAEL